MLSPDFVDQRCPVFWLSITEMDPCSGPCRLHLIDNNRPSFRFLCGGAGRACLREINGGADGTRETSRLQVLKWIEDFNRKNQVALLSVKVWHPLLM